MKWLLWLMPGLGIKRWLVAFSGGLALLALGTALTLETALLATLDYVFRRLIYDVTGNFIPPRVSGITLVVIGGAVVLWSIQGTMRVVAAVLLPRRDRSGEGHDDDGVAQTFVNRRQASAGPRIVVIGGGTGLATLLRGLKTYTDNLTAIVAVTDDGGSSGRLRSETDMLPPGDIRNVIVALADAEPLMAALFQHRFRQGSLAGHSFGNLFILAMSETLGDFEQAVRESSKVLAVRGQVIPATLSRVDLVARLADGRLVRGESAIARVGREIVDLRLDPADVKPLRQALDAIRQADLVVLGPGSLYTSILPGLLMPEMVEVLRKTKAVRAFVVNVMTQRGETDGFTASDHLRILADQAGAGLVDWVVVNTGRAAVHRLMPYRREGSEPVTVDRAALAAMGFEVQSGDLLSAQDLVRHDPGRLARALLQILLDHPRGGRRLLSDLLLAERIHRRGV
ncbi:MAG: YvcK family protein [Thermaerobacterales bacterium]